MFSQKNMYKKVSTIYESMFIVMILLKFIAQNKAIKWAERKTSRNNSVSTEYFQKYYNDAIVVVHYSRYLSSDAPRQLSQYNLYKSYNVRMSTCHCDLLLQDVEIILLHETEANRKWQSSTILHFRCQRIFKQIVWMRGE